MNESHHDAVVRHLEAEIDRLRRPPSDDSIDAAIREWMSSDDTSAEGFRLRMRAAIAKASA